MPPSPSAERGLLEVAVSHPRDVRGCVEGGADRISLGSPSVSATGGTYVATPEPALVSAVVRASDLPVRVVLRLEGGELPTTDARALGRLVGLGEEYADVGAEGFVLGFLDGDLEVDVVACRALLDSLPALPWTFSRAIDDTLDPLRSWGRVVDLPRISAVRSGGSPRGLAQGGDELIALARRSGEVARLLMASGGLSAEQVPWLALAGVRQVHVGAQVRPGGTYRSYVDAAYVRSWRRLLDDAVGRAESGSVSWHQGGAGA